MEIRTLLLRCIISYIYVLQMATILDYKDDYFLQRTLQNQAKKRMFSVTVSRELSLFGKGDRVFY